MASETALDLATKAADNTLTDARGRVLKLRTLNVLDQVRLLRAVGADQSGNQAYMMMVQAACAVAAIDGVPMLIPTNERQIDAAIEKIGDDGFAAVVANLQRQIKSIEAAAEAAAEGAAADPLVPSAS